KMISAISRPAGLARRVSATSVRRPTDSRRTPTSSSRGHDQGLELSPTGPAQRIPRSARPFAPAAPMGIRGSCPFRDLQGTRYRSENHFMWWRRQLAVVSAVIVLAGVDGFVASRAGAALEPTTPL